MITRVCQRVMLLVGGVLIVAVLLAPAIRVLAARGGLLAMEVSDRSALYLVDWQRGLTVSLLEGRVEAPVFSPDGRTIAYLSAENHTLTNITLNLVDVVGGQTRVLVPQMPGVELQSPDGRELAFAARHIQDTFNNSLYIVRVADGELRRLTNALHDYASPAWSPDGTKIAFTMNRGTGRLFNPNIYVIDADCQRLVDDCARTIQPVTRMMSARMPHWSPDGTRIAFVSGNYDQLYVVDADGGNVRSLVAWDGLLWFKWSPDSSRLVFAASQAMQSWRVALVTVASGEVTVLESDRNAVAPVWSPDGQQIAFLGVDNRQFNIYLMDVNGQNQRQVTGRETDTFRVEWSPG